MWAELKGDFIQREQHGDVLFAKVPPKNYDPEMKDAVPNYMYTDVS